MKRQREYKEVESESEGDEDEQEWSDDDVEEQLNLSGGEDDSEGEGDEEEDEEVRIDPNVPLYKLLQRANHSSNVTTEDSPHSAHRTKKVKRERLQKLEDEPKKKRSKSAPAEMRSDRPVRRLRVNADNSTRKFVDPRFADYAGELDQRHFSKNFAFLDEKRENEIKILSKKLAKTKNPAIKNELKQELLVMKQQLNEKKLSLRAMERIEAIKQEEREKVKQGKKQFFLKNSEKKKIIAEERFAELKKQGKLQKFLNKKRKQVATKDKFNMPTRREWAE